MDLDAKFYKLKNEIENGQLRYCIKSVAIVLASITFGKFIGAYAFGDEGAISTFLAELPANIILLLLFGGFFSVIAWEFKLSKYKKESKRRNNT